MLTTHQVHEQVYQLLMSYKQRDTSFYFTFRKSNRDGRLDKGYWFYGNEGYLAVSFWTGMDWKNKTPNIIFVISLSDGETFLEITTSDSDKKREFVNKYVLNKLSLKVCGTKYRKTYKGTYLETLESFIKTDKIIIDKIITQYALAFFGSAETGIYFITPQDFAEQQDKIERYRNALNKNIYFINTQFDSNAIKIKELKIENYGPIQQIDIKEIPFHSQWIFFTGENGTGKTSILRAITTLICSKEIEPEDYDTSEYFQAQFILYSAEGKEIEYKRYKNDNLHQTGNPLTVGFAAYGQSRLKTNCPDKNNKRNISVSVKDLFSSIFFDDAYLIDLQYQLDLWGKNKTSESDFNKREMYITEILTDILPNLYNINFNDEINGIKTTTYIEWDEGKNEF